MDLGGTVTFNGLSLNTVTRTAGGAPTSGYLIERFTPEPPPPTSYLEKRALADGLDAGDVFLGGRNFTLIQQVFGTTPGDFWDKAQDLFHAFSPTIAYSTDSAERGFLAMDFYQPTADISTWPTSAYPDGIPLRYYVRPLAGPTYAIERDRDGGVSGQGRSKSFSIPLIARDPRKYLQSATVSQEFTTANQLAAHRGDYPTFPVITFTLTATGHSNFALTIAGIQVNLDLSVGSSGTFTFDYGKRTLVDAFGASKTSRIQASGGYEQIQPGGTNYRYANPTGIATCTMTYREAFA